MQLIICGTLVTGLPIILAVTLFIINFHTGLLLRHQIELNTTEQLNTYIRKQLARNIPPEQIHKACTDQGWDNDIITNLIAKHKLTPHLKKHLKQASKEEVIEYATEHGWDKNLVESIIKELK